MNDSAKVKFLVVLLSICFITIAGLSYFIWDLRSEKAGQNTYAPYLSDHILPDPWSKNWDPWLDPWDTSGQFENIRKRMDELMSHMKPGGSLFSKHGIGLSQSSPEITMKETNENYQIDVSVPEGQEIELNARIKGDILTISGKVKATIEESSDGLYGKSISTSQFSQSLTLSKPVEESSLSVEKTDKHMKIQVSKK